VLNNSERMKNSLSACFLMPCLIATLFVSDAMPQYDGNVYTITSEVNIPAVKKIRVKAVNARVAPNWHYEKGDTASIFIDEIFVR